MPDAKFSFAYDGIETLKKINSAKQNSKSVDILFLDHYMPGKLGLEVAQIVREREELHSDNTMMIISITNDPDAIDAQKYLFDYHIKKPFSKVDISSFLLFVAKNPLAPPNN